MRLQTLRVRHLHAAELRLPLVERAFADAVTAAYVRRLLAGLLLPQDPDDLLFREPRSLHIHLPSGDGLYLNMEEDSGLTSGDILSGSEDPDLDYNRLIRPWKSRMGLFYVEKQNIVLDIILIALTALAIVSKRRSLSLLGIVLRYLDAPDEMIAVAGRTSNLTPYAPPGADRPVAAGDISGG